MPDGDFNERKEDTMNEAESLERRLALLEDALEAKLPGALREAAARRDAAERDVAMKTAGGRVVVSMLGGAEVAEYVVPSCAGVAAVVYRRVRGGDVQSTELEPHEFESVVDAVAFLDLTQDVRLTLIGAADGEDAEIELAQVADVTFTAADEAEVAA